jgi:hypothetical protein
MTADTASMSHTESHDSCSESQATRRIVLKTPAMGTMWFAGWLFTIGFAQLVWWKALLALVVWPYFLGVLAR